ncbi:splicing suppressor of white-apricot-like protein, partial [Trifolium medium]|nr:splicing suppressor of white-apricot-like protein [Trifolium medium]
MQSNMLQFLCQTSNNDSGAVNSSGYRAVAFSYENSSVSTETKDTDTESGFRPNFPVPESLLNNL